MHLSIVFITILTFVTFAAAQVKKVPVKVLEVGASESDEVFTTALYSFMNKLAKGPKTTRGFVAITGNAEERYRITADIANRASLRSRIEITRPGIIYEKGWEKSEFWLVPEGADVPYPHKIDDRACPNIEIAGKFYAERGESTLDYTANIFGGPDIAIKYRWKVDGGKIVSGDGTPTVTVRVAEGALEIKATVEIIGWKDDFDYGICPTIVTHITKIVQ